MDIDAIIKRQARITRLLKYLDEKKREVREGFFEIADSNIEEYQRPTTTIALPKDFFEKSGLTQEKFLQTRFPSWELDAEQSDDEEIVFILKKRKQYIPWNTTTADASYEISRSISETTPEIDWSSMMKVDGDLFKQFHKIVPRYELDTEAFQHYMAENPQFDAQGFLARHTIHKNPTLRVLQKEVKTDE